MTPDPTTLAVRTDGRPSYRHEPMPLTLAIAPLRSADGHEVRITASVTMRLLDRPSDLSLFREAFLLTADRVTPDDVRQRLLGPVTLSLSEFVARHDAQTCLRQQVAVETLLIKRCDAIGFGCGLTFGPPATLHIESESLRLTRLKADADARRLADLEQAARVAEKLAAVGPVDRLPAADQASLLPTLLRAAAARPARVFVTAGPDLLQVDEATTAVAVTSKSVGPLRCVARLPNSAGRIAIGGQNGVLVLDDNLDQLQTYSAPTQSLRGFNAITRTADGRTLATHGELGLLVWTDDRPQTPTIVPTPPSARLVVCLDERTVLAAGGQLLAFDGSAARPVGDDDSLIVALFDGGDSLSVVRQDGTVQQLDRQTFRKLSQFRAGPVVATTTFIESGLQVLMLAGERTIECRTRNGDFLGRLDVPGPGQRMIAVAGGHVLTVTPDRAAVCAWDWSLPQGPLWTVHVLARTGHHVTDLLAVAI